MTVTAATVSCVLYWFCAGACDGGAVAAPLSASNEPTDRVWKLGVACCESSEQQLQQLDLSGQRLQQTVSLDRFQNLEESQSFLAQM